jgi:hypothetical protein
MHISIPSSLGTHWWDTHAPTTPTPTIFVVNLDASCQMIRSFKDEQHIPAGN